MPVIGRQVWVLNQILAGLDCLQIALRYRPEIVPWPVLSRRRLQPGDQSVAKRHFIDEVEIRATKIPQHPDGVINTDGSPVLPDLVAQPGKKSVVPNGRLRLWRT